MKFTLIALLPLLASCEPERHFRNCTQAFCYRLAPGLYCNPDDALNIVSCPDSTLIPCPLNKFCASVGPVASDYQCEAGFNAVRFCDKRGAGTYCAPEWTHSSGVWSCPDGREHPCPPNAACIQLSRHAAICSPSESSSSSSDYSFYSTSSDSSSDSSSSDSSSSSSSSDSSDFKVLKAAPKKHCKTTTVATQTIQSFCDCTIVTQSPTLTLTSFDYQVSSIYQPYTSSACTRLTVTNTSVVPQISVTEVIVFSLSTTQTNTESFTSFTTSTSTTFSSVTSTFGAFPSFVCLTGGLFTNTENAADISSVCVLGTLNISCVITTANNIGQSFCESYVLGN